MQQFLSELATAEEMLAYEGSRRPIVPTGPMSALRVASATSALALAERISTATWKMSREFRRAVAENDAGRALDAANCFRLQGELLAMLRAIYEARTGKSAAEIYPLMPFADKLRHHIETNVPPPGGDDDED